MSGQSFVIIIKNKEEPPGEAFAFLRTVIGQIFAKTALSQFLTNKLKKDENTTLNGPISIFIFN